MRINITVVTNAHNQVQYRDCNILPQSVRERLTNEELILYRLTDDSKVIFAFKEDDRIYNIGVGQGSKFVVQKSKDGKYTLLIEETAKFSPTR